MLILMSHFWRFVIDSVQGQACFQLSTYRETFCYWSIYRLGLKKLSQVTWSWLDLQQTLGWWCARECWDQKGTLSLSFPLRAEAISVKLWCVLLPLFFKASRCLLYYSEGYLTKLWISRFYERFWEVFIKVFILNQTLGVTYDDWQTVPTFLLKKMMGLSVSCGLLYNFPLESKSWF